MLLASAPVLDVFEASATGNLERLTELLDGDPELVASRSPDSFTALHFAAFFRSKPPPAFCSSAARMYPPSLTTP